MTILPLTVQPACISLSPLERTKEGTKERKGKDMLDFPINRKGFQSLGASDAVEGGSTPDLHWTGESDQSQAQFHKHVRTLGCATVSSRARTPSPPPPVGLEAPQARPLLPPNLLGLELFLPSLPHYLLPLTSAPAPGAEGREDGDEFGGSQYQAPRSIRVGVGVGYEVMRAQSPASKAASSHFPTPAPPLRLARAGVCTSY